MNRNLLAGLLLVGLLAYCFRLGFPDFWGNHWESRRAGIARTMVETGDYLVPVQNGQVTLNKPPVYYWMMAGAMKLIGNHEELGARLPSALAGVVGLAAAARLAFILGGGLAGIWAVLLLLGNVLYFGHARTAEMDMVLLAVEAVALLCFLEARERGGRTWLSLAGWALLGVGFMMKGPVGILVPGITILVYRLADWRDRTGAPRGWIRPGRGLPVFLLVAIPWFLVVLLRVPDAWDIFHRETLTRYSGDLDHREPFWFYVPVILGAFLPGTLVLPVWVRSAFHDREVRSRHLRRLAVAFAILLVFFSASGSKRVYYVLPLWPLLAVGCALAIEQVRRGGNSRWLTRGFGMLAGILALAAPAALLVPVLGGPPFFVNDPLAWSFLVTMAALGIWSAGKAFSGNWELGLFGVSAVLLLAGLFMVQSVGPVSNAYRSRKEFSHAVAAEVPAEASLAMFRESSFAYPFYAGRPIPDLRDREALDEALAAVAPAPLFVIASDRRSDYLREQGYVFEVRLERIWIPPGRPDDRRVLRLLALTSPNH